MIFKLIIITILITYAMGQNTYTNHQKNNDDDRVKVIF